MDNGVAASLFPYRAQRHLAKSAIWKWMARWDLNRYEVSERVPSSIVFCQGYATASRRKRPRRQEERWTRENPNSKMTKEDLRAERGTILVVLQSRSHLLFQEPEVMKSFWKEIMKFREWKTWTKASLFLLNHPSLILLPSVIWKRIYRVPPVLISQIQNFFLSLLR